MEYLAQFQNKHKAEVLAALLICIIILASQPAPGQAQAPSLEISSPEDGSVTRSDTVQVRGTSDATEVKVNGVSAPLTGGSFLVDVPLVEGPNTILVEATNAFGNISTRAFSVARDTVPPTISVIAPSSPLLTNKGTITVAGIVEVGADVKVNGEDATVTGSTFTIEINIDENTTSISIMATDKAGNVQNVMIPVTFYDGLVLNITEIKIADTVLKTKDWPSDGVATFYDWITVSGRVDPGAKVEVNGFDAKVNEDGTFDVEVYIDVGDNTIRTNATDEYGNNMTVTLNIERLEWHPFTVPVEIAVILLMIGIITGSFGGYLLGKHVQRNRSLEKEPEEDEDKDKDVSK